MDGTGIHSDRLGRAFRFEPIQCPICERSDEQELGFRGGATHRYTLGVRTRIVQCRGCSLIFPNPFPYPVAASELYADPDRYFKSHDEAQKIDGYRRLVRDMVRHSGVSGPSLLDVGSGRGELLAAARLEGIERVVGLEFAPAMIDYVRKKHGIEVVPKTIEQYANEPHEPFDAVVLNAVLEHVYNPDSMIAAASKLLRRGGVVYIDVPNEPNLVTRVGNAVYRLQRSDATMNLSPTFEPFHVFGFNPRSLSKLLAKHGFEIAELRIQAGIQVPSKPEWRDRAKAFVAVQLNRLANATGTAANLYVWARRVRAC